MHYHQMHPNVHSKNMSPSLPFHYYVEQPSGLGLEIDFSHWDYAQRIVPLSYFAMPSQPQANYASPYSNTIIRGDKGDVMLPEISIMRQDMHAHPALDSPFIPSVTLEDLACHPSYVLRQSNSLQNNTPQQVHSGNVRSSFIEQRITGSGSLEQILTCSNENPSYTNVPSSFYPINVPTMDNYDHRTQESSLIDTRPPLRMLIIYFIS